MTCWLDELTLAEQRQAYAEWGKAKVEMDEDPTATFDEWEQLERSFDIGFAR